MHNGAVAGTLSRFMSLCHSDHLPDDVDAVVVEYSINDMPGMVRDLDRGLGSRRNDISCDAPAVRPAHCCEQPASPPARQPASQDFDSDQRRGFERLLRKLLGYPKRSAAPTSTPKSLPPPA
jgi:hypothetical protein